MTCIPTHPPGTQGNLSDPKLAGSGFCQVNYAIILKCSSLHYLVSTLLYDSFV